MNPEDSSPTTTTTPSGSHTHHQQGERSQSAHNRLENLGDVGLTEYDHHTLHVLSQIPGRGTFTTLRGYAGHADDTTGADGAAPTGAAA